MNHRIIALAAALTLASTAAYGQNATSPAGPRRHGGEHGKLMQQLGLTPDQQARMKTIHSKYEPQMTSARNAARPDFQALKAARARGDSAGVQAARAKLRADMAPTKNLRKQEMNEMSGILTPSQRQQLATLRAQHKAKHGKHGGRKAGARA